MLVSFAGSSRLKSDVTVVLDAVKLMPVSLTGMQLRRPEWHGAEIGCG